MPDIICLMQKAGCCICWLESGHTDVENCNKLGCKKDCADWFSMCNSSSSVLAWCTLNLVTPVSIILSNVLFLLLPQTHCKAFCSHTVKELFFNHSYWLSMRIAKVHSFHKQWIDQFQMICFVLVYNTMDKVKLCEADIESVCLRVSASYDFICAVFIWWHACKPMWWGQRPDLQSNIQRPIPLCSVSDLQSKGDQHLHQQFTLLNYPAFASGLCQVWFFHH
jgi:hypothetical protein